ncbi:hypothetical protein [Sulfuricurvum sp.]|uniref:hypothetical protein n=1 Tax=Sulfuricurvum sp. TaxID=2025608 RepID=UPI003561741A
MDYKVVRTCFGFRGLKWIEGTIVHDIDPSENPPKHFVPLNQAPKEEPKEPHRTEPKEMDPGKSREVTGGFAHGSGIQKIDRIMTTDKVPNNAKQNPKLKRRPRP